MLDVIDRLTTYAICKIKAPIIVPLAFTVKWVGSPRKEDTDAMKALIDWVGSAVYIAGIEDVMHLVRCVFMGMV